MVIGCVKEIKKHEYRVGLTPDDAYARAGAKVVSKRADMGLEAACKWSPAIAAGVNTYQGACTYENVANTFGMDYVPLDELW